MARKGEDGNPLAMLMRMSDDKDPPPLPHIEAQRHELAMIFASLAKRHKFRAGQFVRYKHGCGPTRTELIGKIAFMFAFWAEDLPEDVWRMHVETMVDAEKRHIHVPDCLIYYATHNSLTVDVSDSRLLEPDPEAHK